MDPTIYPTKDQILSNLYIPSPEEIETIKNWKIKYYDNHWKLLEKKEKIIVLVTLLLELCEDKTQENENWTPKITISDRPWSYNLITQTINIDQNHPSIISALHELGHHFFGKSELEACQFSTGIFKTCFPKAYKNLKWEGHILKTK